MSEKIFHNHSVWGKQNRRITGLIKKHKKKNKLLNKSGKGFLNSCNRHQGFDQVFMVSIFLHLFSVKNPAVETAWLLDFRDSQAVLKSICKLS